MEKQHEMKTKFFGRKLKMSVFTIFISGKKNSDWKQTACFQIVLLEEQMNVKQYS